MQNQKHQNKPLNVEKVFIYSVIEDELVITTGAIGKSNMFLVSVSQFCYFVYSTELYFVCDLCA